MGRSGLRLSTESAGARTRAALHVTDEADSLGFYNPPVLAIWEWWSWLPLLPSASVGWTVGLAALIVLLFVLSPLVFRRQAARWYAAASEFVGQYVTRFRMFR